MAVAGAATMDETEIAPAGLKTLAAVISK